MVILSALAKIVKLEFLKALDNHDESWDFLD